MVLTIKNPADEIFSRWKEEVAKIVGEENCSYGIATDNANDKPLFARLVVVDGSTWSKDLEGDECAISIAVQVELFSTKGLNVLHDLDYVSHSVMVGMGFERTFGAEPIDYIESDIKNLTSRYTMLYTGSFLR